MKSPLIPILCLVSFAAAAQVSTPSALVSEMESTSQGAVISLEGVDPVDCPEMSMSQTWNAGPLIFSDSPESPTTRGILYKDNTLASTGTTATNRVFAYHECNDSANDLKFSVLLVNNGSSSGTLTVRAHGIAGPSTDFPLTGELTFYRWLTNSAVGGVSVAAGATVRLDTNFDTVDVAQGYVMNGIWDYTFNQPHTIIVCALNPSDNPVTVGPTLPVLARDDHERGTFSACNKIYNTTNGYTYDTADGIEQYPIGGSGDAPVTGYDNAVSPHTAETNTGNYGVLYRIHMTASNSDGRDLGFLINPRGGSWCGAVFAESGLLSGGSFIIPSDEGTFSENTEGAVEGEYNPSSSSPIWLQFMPTAGASMPVRMTAVPY